MTQQQTDNLPRHVAIIMDGNNRWARAHGLSGARGHRAGVESVRAVIRRAAERGIETLTLFAFSSENWKRPPSEVSALMELFLMALKREVKKLHEHGIRLTVIGERERFSNSIQQYIERAETLTAGNDSLHLVIAANYGGHRDIALASRRLAARVEAGELTAEAIDEQLLEREIDQMQRAAGRSVHSYQRRAAHLQFSALAVGLFRTVFLAAAVARLLGGRLRCSAQRLLSSSATLRDDSRTDRGPGCLNSALLPPRFWRR